MPFSITSVFQISSVGPRSNNSKRTFYAHFQPEEDTYITTMLIAFDDIMYEDLKEGDHVFITGKAAWVKFELQVSNTTFRNSIFLKNPLTDIPIYRLPS